MNIDLEADLKPALQDFARATKGKVDGVKKQVEELQVEQIKLRDQVRDLEQKAVSGFGSGEPARKEGPADLVVKSGGLDQLRDGQIKKLRVSVGGFQLGTKATLTSGDAYGQAWRDPDLYGPVARPISVRDLLIVRPISVGSVEYLRAGRTGAAGVQAAEGDIKAQIDETLTPVPAPVRTIAAWTAASRQVLDDQDYLIDYINSDLKDALRIEEDAQLLLGDGTGSNLWGLHTQAAAYNRGVAGESAIDQLRRAITQVQLARGVATGIVLNPAGLEKVELTKDADGNYVLAIPVTSDQNRATVWRVPVVVTDALSANQWLVGDFQRSARLYDRQQATVEISTEHADFFTRNLVAILAEERVALAVMRPGLLVKGTFA